MKNHRDIQSRKTKAGLLLFALGTVFILVSAAGTFGQRDLSVATKGTKAFIPEGCRRYEMNITTGDAEGAGTDANIFVTFNGEYGSTGEINLSGGASSLAASNDECSLNGKEFKAVRYFETENEYSVNDVSNLFERNSNWRIVVYARDVGPISSVSLRNDKWGAGPDWLLSRFEIRSPHELVVTTSQWFTSATDTHTFSVAAGDFNQQNETYTIRINTGDVAGAGTDANIDLKIGNSRVIRLNPLISGNAFERNQTDTVKLEKQPIFNPATITITSDDSFSGSAWYLGSIEIDRHLGSQLLIGKYTCNCWVQSGQLSVTLANEVVPSRPPAVVPDYAGFEKTCFDMVQNKVAYDTAGNKSWNPENIKNLCRGTPAPELTVACFKAQMPGVGWQEATVRCSGSTLQQTMANRMPGPPPAIKMPGLARDIDAKNGQAWVIGANPVPGGFSIWKSDGGTWSEVGGGAVRIAVETTGNPWVINSDGTIYRRGNNTWNVINGPNGATPLDIAITGSNEVWIVRSDGSPARWTGSGWTSDSAFSARRIIYLPDIDRIQVIDYQGKFWTREPDGSWALTSDATGLAAKYLEYAIDLNGTSWGIDSSFNIWKIVK